MTASKDLNAAFRQKLLAKGQAMPNDDGPPKFPINDGDDVAKAAALHGQVDASDQPAVKRHIIKVAKKIGATDRLPDDWQPSSN